MRLDLNMILSIILTLSAGHAFAADLNCEVWYQEDHQPKEIIPMKPRWAPTNNYILSAAHKDYSFYVDANPVSGVMYVDIEYGMPQKNVLFVTGRVPTPEVFHFTDLHLPTGLRLAIQCVLK